MLNQEVGGSDLARLTNLASGNRATVVLCHVKLELLDIGALGRLPARVLVRRVEVVG